MDTLKEKKSKAEQGSKVSLCSALSYVIVRMHTHTHTHAHTACGAAETVCGEQTEGDDNTLLSWVPAAGSGRACGLPTAAEDHAG